MLGSDINERQTWFWCQWTHQQESILISVGILWQSECQSQCRFIQIDQRVPEAKNAFILNTYEIMNTLSSLHPVNTNTWCAWKNKTAGDKKMSNKQSCSLIHMRLSTAGFLKWPNTVLNTRATQVNTHLHFINTSKSRELTCNVQCWQQLEVRCHGGPKGQIEK